MSTNFYLQDAALRTERIHLGKRYSAGSGKTGWITDTSHGVFKETVDLLWYLLISPLTTSITDEYGRTVTSTEMMEIIADAVEQDTMDQAFT